ncbi:MAG: hypothetical protein RLZZ292_3801 [Bacteroidota bacterium]|jgi:hypothetical protein
MSETDKKTYITAILDEKQDRFLSFHSALRQNFEFLR